jgi:hypothetical protein
MILEGRKRLRCRRHAAVLQRRSLSKCRHLGWYERPSGAYSLWVRYGWIAATGCAGRGQPGGGAGKRAVEL